MDFQNMFGGLLGWNNQQGQQQQQGQPIDIRTPGLLDSLSQPQQGQQFVNPFANATSPMATGQTTPQQSPHDNTDILGGLGARLMAAGQPMTDQARQQLIQKMQQPAGTTTAATTPTSAQTTSPYASLYASLYGRTGGLLGSSLSGLSPSSTSATSTTGTTKKAKTYSDGTTDVNGVHVYAQGPMVQHLPTPWHFGDGASSSGTTGMKASAQSQRRGR